MFIVRMRVVLNSVKSAFEPDNIKSGNDFNEYVRSFESECYCVLDKVAPEKTVTVTSRKLQPWYNSYIRDQKKIVRNRERLWHKYNKPHH